MADKYNYYYSTTYAGWIVVEYDATKFITNKISGPFNSPDEAKKECDKLNGK